MSDPKIPGVDREATQAEVDAFFGFRKGANFYSPGVNVPPHPAGDHHRFYVSKNMFMIEAEPYSISMSELEKAILFSKEKGWTFTVRQGSRGYPLSILYSTNKSV